MSNVREYRLTAGLSQVELAARAGTTQPTINRLENGGSKLTKEWAERLAPHLKTSAEKLLFGDTPPMPDGIQPKVLRAVIRHLATEYPKIINADPASLADAIVDLCEYVQDTDRGELSRAESGLAIKRVLVAGD